MALTFLISSIFKSKIISKRTAEARQPKKPIYLYFILPIIQLHTVQSLGKRGTYENNSEGPPATKVLFIFRQHHFFSEGKKSAHR